jgi:conjugal transfer pilus assembly protein TraB
MDKDVKAWLAERWKLLPAKFKKNMVIALSVIAGLGIVYMVIHNNPTPRARQQEASKTRSIFGQKGSELQFGIAHVNEQLAKMEKENKGLTDEVKKLTAKKAAAPAFDAGKMQVEIAKQVQQELAKREVHVSEKEKKPAEGQKKAEEKAGGYHYEHGKRVPNTVAGQKEGGKPGPAAKPGAPGAAAASGAAEIKVIGASSEGKSKKKEAEKDIETFLPAGSIFSGTLLTGLDASCGKTTKKDPFPVLLRVKKEAILPNRYHADVRECFLIAAGWGDLGAERAYFRGERLSCIREDGKAIETKIDMFAVGEDGKAGVRGRLVSKTGAVLNKALLAGFMSGFSQIFQKQPISIISTGTAGQNTQTPFQSSLSKNAMESAGLQGTGTALDKLSKYYMDMAQESLPVIEIDAGRAIDFVLISGKSLKLQSRGKIQTAETN